jgi:glycosyltransferase involved in cell wall biosynthesis
MLSELQCCYGPLHATAVIPNGRHASLYCAGRKKPFILSAGRIWDEAKNIAVLSEVQPRVRWRICVAGDDRHPNGGKKPIDSVHLLGKLSDSGLARQYASAAIYCLPARYEPFGLSVLEAALSGCALVLGDIPSLRENWNGAALFAPPGDASRFASTLDALATDDARRNALAAAAYMRAAKFTPDRMADGYAAIYHDALRSRVPTALAGD